jgi:hypothetical protein
MKELGRSVVVFDRLCSVTRHREKERGKGDGERGKGQGTGEKG